MSLENDLLAIENEIWAGGPEAYQAHCDDRCLVVFAEMAAVMSKDDIAKTAEKGRWREVALKTKGLLDFSDTAAVIAYEVTANKKDGQAHHALVSSGYVKRADGWKLRFHQQTAVPQGAAKA